MKFAHIRKCILHTFTHTEKTNFAPYFLCAEKSTFTYTIKEKASGIITAGILIYWPDPVPLFLQLIFL